MDKDRSAGSAKNAKGSIKEAIGKVTGIIIDSLANYGGG